ncbi:MAG TPA: hypothetical protein VKB73_08260 [Gaiellaceae bacterium]|nr:hypothetical protein [Gaiellaceae bacterium]
MSAEPDERLWLRLRQYVDGAEALEVVLAQLIDVAIEIEELSAAGYVLERPVEADGLVLSRSSHSRALLNGCQGNDSPKVGDSYRQGLSGGRRELGMSKLVALTALVGALVLATVASTAGAAPLTDRFHDSFKDNFPDNVCGIDGTTALSVVANVQVFADGTFKLELNQDQLFTSAATGKSVLISFHAQQVNAGPIDNGDGTITFVTTFKGLPERIKLPNGPVLSRDAGFIGFNDTFDATTGAFLGETVSPNNGPHPDADSGFTLFCDVIVPAVS